MYLPLIYDFVSAIFPIVSQYVAKPSSLGSSHVSLSIKC
jgi:hypothetical protein